MLRPIFLSVLLLSMAIAETANAQFGAGVYANAGIGLWGGASGCGGGSGGVKVPDGVQDAKDALDDLRREKKNLEDSKRELKAKLKEAERKQENYKNSLNSVLEPEYASAVIQHATNTGHNDGSNVEAWGGTNPVCDEENKLKPDAKAIPAAIAGNYCSPKPPSGVQQWAGMVSTTSATKPGAVDSRICENDAFTQTLFDGRSAASGSMATLRENCKNGAMYYVDTVQEINLIKAEIDGVEKALVVNKTAQESARKDYREAQRQARRDAEEGLDVYTEANDDCPDCGRYRNAPKISTTDKVISLVGGALGAYLTYRGGKYITDQNARLGWPTSPYLAYGMGAGPLMAGIYGATYGGGVGGFDCGYGAYGPYGMYGPGGLYGAGLYPNMGGVFGYPTGWGGGMGGGLYMPGMGPWGVPGPWGLGMPWGGGVPMVGFIASGIGGAIGGMMMPMMGGMMAPMGGMMMGGMMMPMMGMYGPSMIASGIGGVMGGMMMPMAGGMMMPMAAMAGGFTPYVGAMGPMVAGFGGAIGGMMMPMAGGMMFAPMGGMMMTTMAPMGGMNMQFAMQYQQMMMQQQQMQMQAWMQQAQQQAMATQEITRLMGIMSTVQMQIQQISMGYYTGSSTSILPYPGGNTGGVGSFTGTSMYNGGSYSGYSGYSGSFNGVPAGGGIQGRGRFNGQ